MSPAFTPEEQDRFAADGYLVVPGLADAATVAEIRALTARDLAGRDGEPIGPVEFEAEVGYPGAPDPADREGGKTVRRLKNAFARGPVFTRLLTSEPVRTRLSQLVNAGRADAEVIVPLAHHNCVMTKQPRFSSDTGWHKDVRYWHFARPELVNLWIALGDETPENGCLRVIPGTHTQTHEPSRFDDLQFLRADAPENADLLAKALDVPLRAGDGLFFHARLFHAARRNRTTEPKWSAVFTARPADNPPTPGTRSDWCEVRLPQI
ncbi:phytanoyl-CoA dioxygenase family protein [Alienimonas sp. DA493]|uniref:phytanoyl-CoA dioxygenase family protein n=1 Tax=Alienimonas sp. DA493 TaxID=3373605 RepID=UPI003754939F